MTDVQRVEVLRGSGTLYGSGRRWHIRIIHNQPDPSEFKRVSGMRQPPAMPRMAPIHQRDVEHTADGFRQFA